MPAGDKKATSKSAKATTGFSSEERAAIKERVREQKARAAAADGESEVQAKIAAMSASDRALAERLHAIIKASAPSLTPTTWYGMPAYARDGKLICHFQPAEKFKTRYASLGFSDKARLDDGGMWPVAFAITKLSAEDEKRIAALVKKAVG